MGNKKAKRQIEEGKADKRAALGALNSFEYGKQVGDVKNPFGDVTNPFADIQNPFANLRVGTASADYQREANAESFASILDAQVQGGGGAGQNATSLARAAAQANQQISAGLEKQELGNQLKTAEGQLKVDTLKGQGSLKAQELRGRGAQFVQQVSEKRDTAKLDGLGNQLAGAQQTINAGYKAISDNNAAWIKGVTGLAGTVLTAGAGGGAGGSWGFGGE